MQGIGALVSNKTLGDRIIKVNHAGENGAIAIYSGQLVLARFTAPSLVSDLEAFRSHEYRHRAIFCAELERRHHPRCRSYHLCGLGGYLLGLFTGLLGARAIAATTVAVESVVLKHLEQQLATLRGIDQSAVDAISAIVEEERQHHDQSENHQLVGTFWMRILKPIVSGATETVIWLGMRL